MLGLIGISFKTAPVEVREKFSFSESEIVQFVKLLKIDTNVKGGLVLSTCNRTEIYFHIDNCSTDDGYDFILRNMQYFKGYDEDIKEHFYFYDGKEATDHLFSVVSGLDSLVMGEDQILGQVKNAFKLSIDNNQLDTVLLRMFNKAFEASKRVRTETTINQGAGSVSSASVLLCERELGSITDKTVMLVGAGKTGELALLNFSKRECKSIYVTNRTFSKADNIAAKYHGTAIELDKMEEYLHLCDIILVATSSTKQLITSEMVERSLQKNDSKKLFIDISVPRNICEKVGELPNVKLHTVDNLKEIVSATSSKRKDAIQDAKEIINIVKQEFYDWLNALELTPTILKIRRNFHKVNKSELEGFIKIKSVENSDVVSDYANHITEKYARLFIRNLKSVTDNGKKKEYIDFLNELFELQ
jgi:glutamyl-tRNA reductase